MLSSSSSVILRGQRWWFLKFTCVFILVTIPLVVHGNITIVSTGQRFPSRNSDEGNIGKRLWKGYEYYGRLQALNPNVDLCGDDETTTIIPSADGIPIALLLLYHHQQNCDLRQQIHYILHKIQPTGMIRYVILPEETPASFLDHEEDDESNNNNDQMTMMVHEVENVYLMQVSEHTRYQLLQVIQEASPEVINAGGPRITLDSRTSTKGSGSGHGEWGDAAVWVAVTALLSACACSFLLLITGGWYDDEFQNQNQQHQNDPHRPVRRKLTKNQVRNKFPVYRYDGQHLHPVMGHQQQYPSSTEDGHGATTNGVDDSPLLSMPFSLQDVQLDQECSICLEEYEVSDKIRILPHCKHTFHARCIAKWLTERSATCPLCKDDLYESDHEDEEEDHVGDNPIDTGVGAPTNATATMSDLFSFNWWSRWNLQGSSLSNEQTMPEGLNDPLLTTTQQQQQGSLPLETVIGSTTIGAPAMAQPETSSSWWSRIVTTVFPTTAGRTNTRRGSSNVMMEAEMLAQPLLEHHHNGDDEEAQQQQPERRMVFPSSATSLLDTPTNNGVEQEPHTSGDTGSHVAALVVTSTATIIPTNSPSVTPPGDNTTVTNNNNTILEMVPASTGPVDETTITTISESTGPVPCAELASSLSQPQPQLQQ